MKTQYIDLHTHSTYSDGTSTPKDVVMAMKLRGVDIMALTDHDTIKGYEEAKQEAERWGLTLIPGAEFTTKDYHILGLNIDTKNSRLLAFLDEAKIIRDRVCANRVNILQEHGVPITMDIIRHHFPYQTLGKPHLTTAMILDPNCRKYVNQKHESKTLLELMRHYLGKEGIIGPYKTSEGLPNKEVIDTIHSAGGLAIIAHPIKDLDSLEELDQLRLLGIDGLEIQFRHYNDGYKEYEEYAEEHDLLITYGSDYHGPGYAREIMGRGKNILNEKLERKLLEHEFTSVLL